MIVIIWQRHYDDIDAITGSLHAWSELEAQVDKISCDSASAGGLKY